MMRALLLILASLVPAPAGAVEALSASVDRIDLRGGDVFTLTVRGPANDAIVPQWDVLDADFELLSRSERLDRGGAGRQRIWTLRLRVLDALVKEIPPVPMGSLITRPIRLLVRPRALASLQSLESIETQLSAMSAYVGSQVIYTVRRLVTGNAYELTVSKPVVTAGAATLAAIGPERRYVTTRDGRSYQAAEQDYALTPTRSGTLSLAPIIVVTHVEGADSSGQLIRNCSQSVSLSVKSLPPAPGQADSTGATVARHLSVTTELHPASPEGSAPDSATIMVTIHATGTRAAALPVAELVAPTELQVFRGDTQLVDDQRAIEVSRRDVFVVTAAEPGRYPLVPTNIPWFNTESGRWEVAQGLPVVANLGAASARSVRVEYAAKRASHRATTLIMILSAMGVATVLLWTLLRIWFPMLPFAGTAAARCWRRLRLACRSGDARAASDALLKLGKLRWPQQPPEGLGSMAGRVPARLSQAILRLAAQMYGPDAGACWSGLELWENAGFLREHGRAAGQSMATGAPSLAPLWPDHPGR
jgi:hypothetical protein